MGNKIKLGLFSLSALALLAACGDTTPTDDPTDMEDPVVEEPTPPVEDGMEETEDNTEDMNDEETP